MNNDAENRIPSQVGLSGMALSRSISPAVATSIFAFGVSYQVLWGQLAWLVLFVAAAGNNVLVRYLPQKAWGKSSKENAAGVDDSDDV